MSIQAQLWQEVMNMLPKTSAYLDKIQKKDNCHGANMRGTIEQKILSSYIPLAAMTEKQLAKFDREQLRYLKEIEAYADEYKEEEQQND